LEKRHGIKLHGQAFLQPATVLQGIKNDGILNTGIKVDAKFQLVAGVWITIL
jgi:hypothetical protein